MTNRTRLLAGLALIILAGGGWWLRQGAEAPRPATPAAAATAPGVGALGRVDPASRIRKLSAPGGFNVTRIQRVLVTEGDQVRAGQLLAEFGDIALKDATVAQSQAAVAEAEATLAKVRAAGRPSEIEAQRARIRNLLAVEAINRRDAQRAEYLVPSGAGAFAVADRSRAQADAAAAARAEAEAALETLSRPRPEDVALAEAQLTNAMALLAKAQADAALSRIYAPINGTILKLYARAGDPVGSDGLLEMADLERLDVIADVFETDLPRLRLGAEAEVIVPGDTQRYTATVRELGWLVRRTTQAGTDPVAAVDSRTVEVRLALSEAGRQALLHRSNMQVQVAIRP
jgi:HlyD family secretion protein